MTEMKIVRTADDRIQPESGFRARIRSGDMVKVTAEPGARGEITFTGVSPFGKGHLAVRYGAALPITAPFVPKSTASNVYRFTCQLTVGDQTYSSKSGGEIEVIKG